MGGHKTRSIKCRAGLPLLGVCGFVGVGHTISGMTRLVCVCVCACFDADHDDDDDDIWVLSDRPLHWYTGVVCAPLPSTAGTRWFEQFWGLCKVVDRYPFFLFFFFYTIGGRL